MPPWPSSLRARLAALFALGTACLLVLSAGVLYVNLSGELDRAVNDGLRGRARDLAADVTAGAVTLHRGDAFAQLVALDGTVLDASPSVPERASLLRPGELRRSATAELVVDRDVAGLGRDARLLARPARAGDRRLVVVVGESRRALVAAQRRLALGLAVASPVLVAILAGGGWLVAGAALRPVDRMTAEARRISVHEPGRRLPLPPGDDEIARLGRTLNSMLGRIEAAFAHEQAFVDDASHELRTPVSILRAELELALLEPGVAGDVRAALESALEEAHRLSRLADDLLVLARVTGGRLPVTPAPTDVDELARRVAARLETPGGPRVTVSGPPLRVDADPDRLEQLLVNLVANARRHAHAAVAVVLDAAPASVRVNDDGPGFAADVLPRAFERFVRGKGPRGHAGAGLGLSIVQAIADAHGWRVSAGNGGALGGAEVRVEFSPGRDG